MKVKSKQISPAEQAAFKCMKKVSDAIASRKHFLVEAGAGAGKTYTLINALKSLIEINKEAFLRSNSRIACITYTNVAKDEITSKTDNHPLVYAETIHAFCWDLIKDFQKNLRGLISGLGDKWAARILAVGGTAGSRAVRYNLGYPGLTDTEITLHHDDVIKLMTALLAEDKFRQIIKNRFPIILIDEYQDTSKALAAAIVDHLIVDEGGPLIGFFGDHWQQIYGSSSCGLITAPADRMTVIGKQANFRSDRLIVHALNRMRPMLKQHESDPTSGGEIRVFHSNAYTGIRRSEAHWKGDLPAGIAHEYLDRVKASLEKDKWVISAETTKILMLTNSVLANEQGYAQFTSVFTNTDDYLKKNDDYISFLSDVVEPGAVAFSKGRYGEMMGVFDIRAPKIRKHADKLVWHTDMQELANKRASGTIGEIIDILKRTQKPRLPKQVEEKEKAYLLAMAKPESERDENEKDLVKKISGIRAIPYQQLVNVASYIEDKTLFSTKHGVKGAQFDNVLVVFGRGWNQYNWKEMLEMAVDGVPLDRQAAFERNRNLFYVACSRPKHRLALLFTQELSDKAIGTLENWFGVGTIAI